MDIDRDHAGVAPASESTGAAPRSRLAILLALTALVVAGCGGGGSADPAAATAASQAPVPAGGFASSALSANICVAPRTGTDPSTGAAFPDRQGTLAQEQSWVRSWIDETYLWYNEIPTTVVAENYATPLAFFAALRTPALTASGQPRDRFHFTYPTDVWKALSGSGVEAGYGFQLTLLKPKAPRDVRVAYLEPGTAAVTAGVIRGDKVLAVDSIDVINGSNVDALNAALFPTAAGQSHSFQLQQPDGTLRTVQLTSAQITKTPVQNVETLETASGRVGYLQFNDHDAPSEAQLIAAFNKFKADAVQDLVLDMRYNGGGLLDIASELAFMVAGSARTSGAAFERLQFNNKNPFNLTEAQTVTSFHSTTQGFSAGTGQALPQLGLSRVTVLTGAGTCSASESVINGLRGVNVQVTQIGATTCGKPYGFIPKDNCGTTYFAIQFKGVNNQGAGDYSDGLAPTCSVADDFSHPLGNVAEGRLAAALSYRSTGACPAASATASLALQSSVLSGGEPLASGKSPARENRLLRPGLISPP